MPTVAFSSRALRCAALAFGAFVLALTPRDVIAQGTNIGSARDTNSTTRSPSSDSSHRPVVPLGLDALAGRTAAPGVVGSVDTTTAPLLGAGEPLDALAGTLAGVRVYRPSGEPGDVPLVALHGRTTVHRTPAPLYVFDGVPLAAPPVEIVAPGLQAIDVISAQLAASWLGSAAHDGLIHLRTGPLEAPLTGFATRVYSEVGTGWNPGRVVLNRHHDFLMNDAGQYVDADGNVVDRANRVRDPIGIMDKAYSGGTFDPVDALFTSGMRHSISAEIAGSLPKSSLHLSLGHDRDAGVVREIDPFLHTHVHVRSEHPLRDDLRLDFTGYYARSERGEPRLADRLGRAYFAPPDVDLLARTPDGEYIRDPVPEFGLNPVWMLANARSTIDRERLILGLRAAWTPRDWLTMNAALGHDGLVQDGIYSVAHPSVVRTEREHSFRSRTSAALALTGRRELFGAVASYATLAWNSMPLRDSMLIGLEEGTPCLPGSCEPAFSATIARWSRTSQRTMAAHVGGSLDERLQLDFSVRREHNEHFPRADQGTTGYRATARSALNRFGWWPLLSLDRLVLSASWGTLVGFMSRDEVYEGLQNQPIPGTPAFRWQAERDREMMLAADLGFGDRLTVQLAQTWVKTEHAPVVTGGTLEAREWATAARLDREGFEASVSGDLIRRTDVAWTVGLTASRQELTFRGLDMPCTFRNGLRICVGEIVGQLFAGRWLHAPGELPALHDGSHSAFAVNDDGFLVPIGTGGSLATPQWGTTVTIDGIEYDWGLPIPITDQTGTPVLSRIGDPTHWAVGLSSVVRWRAFTLAAVISAQLGGELWDETGQYGILSRQNAVLDQAGKPEALRKPFAYYDRLRVPYPNEFFVKDASHAVLQQLALRFRFGARWLGGGPIGADRVELALIGRNLAGWSERGGLFDELDSPMAATDVLRHPRPRTLSVRLGVDF